MPDSLREDAENVGKAFKDQPKKIAVVLEEVGIEGRDKGEEKGYFVIGCPKCNGRAALRYGNAEMDENPVFWLCFENKCQKEWHSSFVGLLRCKRGDPHPKDTVQFLRDVWTRQKWKKDEAVLERNGV